MCAPHPSSHPPPPPCARPPQGCWQLCLEELLGGSNPTAATFLAGGCGPLKSALGLEPLFLTQYAADPSLYTQDGMQCIWCGRGLWPQWAGGRGEQADSLGVTCCMAQCAP